MAEFNSQSYAAAKELGPTVMLKLIDARIRMVRFSDVTQLDQALRQLGFGLIKREPYGPPGGRQGRSESHDHARQLSASRLSGQLTTIRRDHGRPI